MEKDITENRSETYENICCICLEPFTMNNIYVMKCNHFLCSYCFDKLKMYQLSLCEDVSCPQCRNVEIKCKNQPIFLLSYRPSFQNEESSYDVLHEVERHVLASLYDRSISYLLYFSMVSFLFMGLSAFVYWLNYCSKNSLASVCFS
jgi:hypothetical protein